MISTDNQQAQMQAQQENQAHAPAPANGQGSSVLESKNGYEQKSQEAQAKRMAPSQAPGRVSSGPLLKTLGLSLSDVSPNDREYDEYDPVKDRNQMKLFNLPPDPQETERQLKALEPSSDQLREFAQRMAANGGPAPTDYETQRLIGLMRNNNSFDDAVDMISTARDRGGMKR